MDSQFSGKLNSFQRDLKELELREQSLTNELDEVQAKIKLIRKEIAELTKSDRVTQDILERVYSQRKSFNEKK